MDAGMKPRPKLAKYLKNFKLGYIKDVCRRNLLITWPCKLYATVNSVAGGVRGLLGLQWEFVDVVPSDGPHLPAAAVARCRHSIDSLCVHRGPLDSPLHF